MMTQEEMNDMRKRNGMNIKSRTQKEKHHHNHVHVDSKIDDIVVKQEKGIILDK